MGSEASDSTNAGADKPILAVRGQDVYVVYNHAQTIWSASSHDGGATFTEVKVNQNGKLGWSLAGGGTVLPLTVTQQGEFCRGQVVIPSGGRRFLFSAGFGRETGSLFIVVLLSFFLEEIRFNESG